MATTNENFKYQLSVNLMVKNEIKYIEKCILALLKLKQWINMELIIVDTGSTDGTVEIAKKYADKYLEFEWCDDFAAARNVAVEVAEGEWFMPRDADEIFEDDSIIEIAKFINSPNRDNYDCGAIFVHDLHKDAETTVFNRTVLFNFTKGKRKFIYANHEAIPCDQTKKAFIGAHCIHYGALNMDTRVKRNSPYLEAEMKNDPNNYRNHYHYANMLKIDEKLPFLEKTIKHFKDNENPFDLNISIIYCQLAGCYSDKDDIDKLLALKDDYFSYQNNNFLPNLDVNYMCAMNLYYAKRYEEAIPYFQKYQQIYCSLLKTPDVYFSSMITFRTNNNVFFGKSLLMTSMAYAFSKNENKAKEYIYMFRQACGGSKSFADDFLAMYILAAKLCREIALIIEIYKSIPYRAEGYLLTTMHINSLINNTDDNDPNADTRREIIEGFALFPCDGYVALNRLRLANYDVTKCDEETQKVLKIEKNYLKNVFLVNYKAVRPQDKETSLIEEALDKLD